MAGRGSRFSEAHFADPKPLIPLMGMPMINWVINNLRPQQEHRFIFICLEEHLIQYPEIEEQLINSSSNCVIHRVNKTTEGAACTVLLVRELIDNDDQLMIANSDQIVSLNVNEYLAELQDSEIDALIMTFNSNDPKWSYCRLSEDGFVMEVVEKQVVSNEATVGVYNFKRGCDFVSAADQMIASNLRVNNEFYVAPCYNQLILRGMKVRVKSTGIEYNGMHGLGIPQDLAHFLTTKTFLDLYNQTKEQLISLSFSYCRYFQERNIAAISEMLDSSFVLIDPSGKYETKDVAMEYISKLLLNSKELVFFPKSIFYSSENKTFIHFYLQINNEYFEGVDCVDWKNNKIVHLTAFLNKLEGTENRQFSGE